MNTLVVFESTFGNTEAIAKAVAEGLSTSSTVHIFGVDAAPTSVGADIELLVVGGPTHGFGMSRPGTRQEAAKEAAKPETSGIGIREWIDELEVSAPVAAATFDTRFKKPRWLVGSAARSAEKRFRQLGFVIAVPPESFFVSGTTGPLMEGETDRARQWGARLASESQGRVA